MSQKEPDPPPSPEPPEPDEQPVPGSRGPRTPYPVNDPGIIDPARPGSEPDYLPGRPIAPDTQI